MADTTIAVQPASAAPTAAPVQFELAQIVNSAGQLSLVQAVTLLDELGRPFEPLSEETGQEILRAIKELSSMFASANGLLAPNTPGLLQSNN